MTLAFVMLAIGGILIGGAWSFHRQKNPAWTVIALALAGVLCVAVAIWRIQQGA